MALIVVLMLLCPRLAWGQEVTPLTAADTDFAARCAAAGVVKCWGFNNTTDVANNVNMFPAGDAVFRYTLDTAVKASGAASLRFNLPPPPHSGQNIAGNWTPPNGNLAMGGQIFKENSTFYVSYRVRFSPFMMENNWQTATQALGWKVSIFHYNQSTCDNLELTQREYNSHNMPILYTDCGANNVFAGDDGNWQQGNITTPPLHLQQGTWFPTCTYPASASQADTNCFRFPPNEWLTFKYKVTIGTWNGSNSRIEGWVSTERVPAWRKLWDVSQYNLTCNNFPGCASNAEGFNNISLLPYMTGVLTTSGLPYPTYVWYDELIVSTQDIAAPGAATDDPVSQRRSCGGGLSTGGGVGF